MPDARTGPHRTSTSRTPTAGPGGGTTRSEPVQVAVAVDAPAHAASAIVGITTRVCDAMEGVEVAPLSTPEADACQTRPDVILALASGCPIGAGPMVTEIMANLNDPPPVVAATLKPDAVDARQALTAGARGYVTMVDGLDALEEAVRVVAGGDVWVAPSVGAALAADDGQTQAAGLDPRERDVLRLLALGYTNAEAAAELRFSVRTIESVRGAVCHRLGLASRRELVAAALGLGLLRDRVA